MLPLTPKWQLHQLFSSNRALFSDDVRHELARAYPGLKFVTDEETKIARALIIKDLSEQAIDSLLSDIQFLVKFPSLPAKYISVGFDRFCGNKELLEQAKRISICSMALLTDPDAVETDFLAGCIAKYWIQRGFELCIADGDAVKAVSSNQVWLLSNYRSEQSNVLSDLIRQVHEHRNVLIVTSLEKIEVANEYHGRRMRELCTPQPMATWGGALASYVHEEESIRQLQSFFALRSIVTSSVVEQLMHNYPSLVVRNFVPEVHLLAPTVLDRLTHDLAFFISFPRVPVGHISSRVSTFQPHSVAQKELLLQVQKFSKRQDTKACFLSAATGVGKTHLAVGLAKRFFHHNHERLYFVTPDSAEGFLGVEMAPGQFWIFDDCNFYSSYPRDMITLLQKAIVHTHTNGGILLVTSCFSWQEIVERCAANGQPLDEKMAQALFFT